MEENIIYTAASIAILFTFAIGVWLFMCYVAFKISVFLGIIYILVSLGLLIYGLYKDITKC